MNDFVEFSTQNWLLFLALFAITGMLIGGEVLRKMRGVSSLSAAEALRLINDQEALILDVRDGGEYKEGHIPQARHIPLGALRDRLGELTKAKDKPIVVYCRNGATSQAACAQIKKSGIVDVYSLSGGLSAWQEANLPVSRKKS
ncbi:MAG: rhodanese-like domain-containing protein [Candidatus Competibacteraceae bacterium]|nr:rhodanese-like domain-containing protein [Candidatus Competibacteraceae bacterium]